MTRSFGKRGEKVEADFMVAATRKVEEILCHMKKPAAFNILAEFLLHFPNDRGRCLLAHFDSTTRQGPVFVAWRSMKQYMAVMKNYRGGAHLESLALEIN